MPISNPPQITGLLLDNRPPMDFVPETGKFERFSQLLVKEDSRSIISTSFVSPLAVVPRPIKTFVKPVNVNKIKYQKQDQFRPVYILLLFDDYLMSWYHRPNPDE